MPWVKCIFLVLDALGQMYSIVLVLDVLGPMSFSSSRCLGSHGHPRLLLRQHWGQHRGRDHGRPGEAPLATRMRSAPLAAHAH